MLQNIITNSCLSLHTIIVSKVQLLHRLKIRSADGNDMLLKVVKNPMSRHLPAGTRCYGKF